MTASVARQSPLRNRRALLTLATVLLLFVVGAGIPIAIAAHYGALDVPRSDDWSYLLSLFRWVDTGHLDFNGWVSMTLVGQLVIAAPLVLVVGRSIAAVHVLSAFVSFLGLLAVLWMSRLMVRPALAVLVAITIAVCPIWGPLSTTYMTDNWAFTFQILAVALAFEAFRRRPISMPWLTGSLAVGLIAFSIRQYAAIPVVAVVAVALVLVAREHNRKRWWHLVAIIASTGVLAIALLAWWGTVPDTKLLAPALPGLKSVRWTVRLDTGYLRLVGVALAPVLIAAGPLRLVRRAFAASKLLSTLIVVLVSGVLVLQFVRLPNVPFVGNYFARDGVLAQDVLAGLRPAVIPGLVFDALAWVGMVSVVVMLLAAVPFAARLPEKARGWRTLPESPQVAVLALSIIGFAVAYTLATLTELPVFDRYALPLLPMIALLLLHAAGHRPAAAADPNAADAERVSRAGWVAAAVGVVVLGLVGMAYTAESASYDATRWSVGEMAVAKGYSPLQIDDGFEWVGWHRMHGPPWRVKGTFSERRKIRRLYSKPFCVKVSVGHKVAEQLIIASAVSEAPTRGPVRIIARKLPVACTPGKPVGVDAARRAG